MRMGVGLGANKHPVKETHGTFSEEKKTKF